METRAPLALIGLFVLAAIGAVFGFVYWLNSTGGLGERAVYTIRFESTVSGLLRGAAVQFNGIRVGEVTELRLNPEDAKQVLATIAVARGTPIRADTRIGLDFQGLTGVPIVTLDGGTGKPPEPARPGAPPMLTADPSGGLSMTQAARDTLRRLDQILAENSDAVRSAIANVNTFSAALARNSDRVDGILKGLERMTGGGPASAPPVVYDLTPPRSFPAMDKALPGPVAVPELTTVLLYDTQRILVRPSGGDDPSFETARWSDTLPKLLQARIVQSFENASFLGTVTKPIDGATPKYQLLIDLRRFQVSVSSQPMADIEFTAKIIGEDSKVVAARIFQVTEPAKATNASAAAASLNDAFQKIVTDLVVWTATSI
jgi:phospholipid/cholesterol/gamma-HCH transport system substrate-binding protein